MTTPSARIDDPGPGALGPRAAGGFVPDAGIETVGVRSARAPRARGSLGFAGAFVEVTSEDTFIPGVLIVRVDPERIASLDPLSLRLFRWDARSERLRMVKRSGVGEGYVWGRIVVPGRYGVVGLSSDPAAMLVVGALSAARPLVARLGPEARDALHRRICSLAPQVTAEGTTTLDPNYLRLNDPFALPEFDLTARGGADRWRSLSPGALTDDAPPVIGPLLSLTRDPGDPTRLYVGTAGTGAWRLDGLDAEPGWTLLTDPAQTLDVTAIGVSPLLSSIVYAADGAGRVMLSRDAGTTWAQTSEQSFGRVSRLLVDPDDPNRLYVATASRGDGAPRAEPGLWVSIDAGQRWRRIVAGEVDDAAIDPADGATLYAAVRDEGLLRSDDGGDNWVLALAFVSDVAHGGHEIRLALGGGNDPANRTVGARFGQEVFVSRHAGRRLDTGGGSWVSTGWHGGETPENGRGLIAIDPHDDEVVLTGGIDLVRTTAASAPAGGEWETVVDNAGGRDLLHDRVHLGLVLLGGDTGLARSTDGGSTWSVLHHRSSPMRIERATVTSDSVVADLGPAGLITTTRHRAGVWSPVETLGDDRSRRIVADPGGPTARADNAALDGVVLVGTSDRILRVMGEGPEARTDDPDIGWSANPIAAIAFAPSAPETAYAMSLSGEVFHEPDTLRPTWMAWAATGSWHVEGVHGLAVNLLDDHRIYAVAGHQIGRSPDRGGSWQSIRGSADGRLPDAALTTLLTHPNDPEALVVAGEAGVFLTTNEGLSWRACDEGIPRSPVVTIGWWGDELVVVTAGRGVWTRRLGL